MTQNVLFISEQAIKTNTVINSNIDNVTITGNIIDCQNIYINSILGSGLYNEIVEQIKTSGLTSDNIILLEEYIHPTLKNYVISSMLPDLNYQIRNGSVSELAGDTFQTADLKKLEYMVSKYRNIAEGYALKMSKYLCANPDKYPLYRNPGTTPDTDFPEHDAYRSPVTIPRKKY